MGQRGPRQGIPGLLSYRREQNRKARRGRTPAELEAGLSAHLARYEAALEHAARLELEQELELQQGLAQYWRGAHYSFTYWPNTGDECPWNIPGMD